MATTLELWQTEWCPASHRVRQRLTELGLSFVAHQVPVERAERDELEAVTGGRSIPVLIDRGRILAGEDAIAGYLERHFTEPRAARSQRDKALKAKRKELEEACPKLAAAATR